MTFSAAVILDNDWRRVCRSNGRSFRLFVVLFILTIISVLASDELQACEILGYYSICIDDSTYQEKFSDIDDRFDYEKADTVAHNTVLEQLDKSGARVRAIPHDHYLTGRWVELTTESFASHASQGLQASGSAIERTNSYQAILLKAVNKGDILLTADMSRYPEFLIAHSKLIDAQCRQYVSSGAYVERGVKLTHSMCFAFLTGNLTQAWEGNEPDAVRAVYYLLGSMWSAAILAQQLHEYVEENQRQVYEIVADGKRISPRVSRMGNLYLPSDMIDNANSESTELILLHESAHLSVFARFMYQNLLSGIAGKMLDGDDVAKIRELEPQIRPFLQASAQMQEMSVDLSVISRVIDDESKRNLYTKIISEVESLYPERLRGLELLNELANRTGSRDYLDLVQEIGTGGVTHLDGEEIPQPVIGIARQYVRSQGEYFATLMAGATPLITGDLSRDPWTLERQISQSYTEMMVEFFETGRPVEARIE